MGIYKNADKLGARKLGASLFFLAKEDLKNPRLEIQTDMAFLDLVNLRLDHVKAYNSKRHYEDLIYRSKRWIKTWGNLSCGEITQSMFISFLMEKRKVSSYTGNIELRLIRALYNYGIKRKLINANPTDGIEFCQSKKSSSMFPLTRISTK